MKIHRLNSLREQYNNVKSEAMKFMQSGDLRNYLKRLTKATKIQNEYMETLKMQV
jgi:hypothetical protein